MKKIVVLIAALFAGTVAFAQQHVAAQPASAPSTGLVNKAKVGAAPSKAASAVVVGDDGKMSKADQAKLAESKKKEVAAGKASVGK